MITGICKSPDTRYWRALYKAALSEIGNSKLPERIAEAEKAVVLRASETSTTPPVVWSMNICALMNSPPLTHSRQIGYV